jgi:hypothetical protein
MNGRTKEVTAIVVLLALVGIAQARIKLVALPERADTVIRLDNPRATLIEEERVLTLQQGLNKVDFSSCSTSAIRPMKQPWSGKSPATATLPRRCASAICSPISTG